MKFALILALTAALSGHASQLGLTSLHLPIYFHSDMDPALTEQPIPFATSYASPEARLGAMTLPYVPHHDASWTHPVDATLITIYGLSLSFEQIEDSRDYRMTIDASKAKRPADMPFTLLEVVESTKRCATLNFSNSGTAKLHITTKGLSKNTTENKALEATDSNASAPLH